jgi:hypothetical protein
MTWGLCCVPIIHHKKRGVSHAVALPFTLKSILGKRKNYENSNIPPCNNIIFKISSKRNQNPSSYYNSITNLKFQHKPKYHVSKNPLIRIDLLLHRGQNPLSYYLSTLANLTLIYIIFKNLEIFKILFLPNQTILWREIVNI